MVKWAVSSEKFTGKVIWLAKEIVNIAGQTIGQIKYAINMQNRPT